MTERLNGDQSFLGRVFDSYQNMMQIARCLREAARQKPVAPLRLLELSRRETGIQEYVPEARVVRHPTHEDDLPTLTDPVALPFADKSFDACLVSDAYEHLPATMRPGLLSEMLRVTDGLVLVGCPQGNEVVSRFDKLVFDFIWGKYGERFKPLEQHAEYGLEPAERVVETLKAQGADRVTILPGNYVYRWIHMILIFFDLQHMHPYWHLFEPFNRIYNERLSPYDYREPCYRYLIAIATHPGLDVSALDDALKAPREEPAFVGEADGVLAQTFREVDATAADQLRQCWEEIERLRQENGRAAREVELLKAVNQQLEQDHARCAQSRQGGLKRLMLKMYRSVGNKKRA